MKRSQILTLFFVISLTIISTACERERTGCDDEAATPKPTLQLTDLLAQTPEPDLDKTPIQIEIKGKMTQVDKLVDYPICNDDWNGIVYINCDAQVAEAELDANDNPLFFKGCNLNIEPNTFVYVAAHNNEAFYKGCSCHTGGEPIP